MLKILLFILSALWLYGTPSNAFAQIGDDPIPPFFVETFLDLPEDVLEAAQSGRRLLLYFGQSGCPYCKKLIETNFTQRRIVDISTKHFLPMAFDIFGAREVTWFDGKIRDEKTLARFLRVQFTPTVLLLDEKGSIIARLNGYYPPHRFLAALQYAAYRQERDMSFAEAMRRVPQKGAHASLHEDALFMSSPLDLSRKVGGRVLAVFFETPYCEACDTLHYGAMQQKELRAWMSKMDIAQLPLSGTASIITPNGHQSTISAFVNTLHITYVPSIVFFDDQGAEIFRIDAYFKKFHLAKAFEYIQSAAYLKQPEFQRWLTNR